MIADQYAVAVLIVWRSLTEIVIVAQVEHNSQHGDQLHVATRHPYHLQITSEIVLLYDSLAVTLLECSPTGLRCKSWSERKFLLLLHLLPNSCTIN